MGLDATLTSRPMMYALLPSSECHAITRMEAIAITRSELISCLYSHFAFMHDMWEECSTRLGVGALVFLPEDYLNAREFNELDCHFWRKKQLMEFLKSKRWAIGSLAPEEDDFLSRANDHEFLSVVVGYNKGKDQHELEFHRIDRAILN